jgi:hypothetical protein
MARWNWIGALALVAGCGGAASEGMPPQHMSASEHDRAAQRHEQQASQGATAPAGGEQAGGGTPSFDCFDQSAAAPEPDSGGERIPVLRPCWTAATQPPSDAQKEAARRRR